MDLHKLLAAFAACMCAAWLVHILAQDPFVYSASVKHVASLLQHGPRSTGYFHDSLSFVSFFLLSDESLPQLAV